MSSNKFATILYIANMFWSINLDKKKQTLHEFYYNRRIYRHARLGQGLKISPYIAVKALRYTLSPTVLQSFLSSIRRQYRHLHPNLGSYMGPTGFALYCCQGSTLCPAGGRMAFVKRKMPIFD